MGLVRVAALLGLVIGHSFASTSMMICNEDNCLRAIQASVFTTVHGTADCSSYFLTTVIPATSTVTATATVYSLDAATGNITSQDIETIQTSTSTVTQTITGTTEVPVRMSPRTVASQASTPAKKLVETIPQSLTVVPSSVPVYASACSGSVHYSSACSCIGVTNSITTVSPPSITTTVTITLGTTTTKAVTANSTGGSTTTDACGTAGSIKTVTATAPTATVTYYAACDSSKLIGSHDGLGITAAVPHYNFTMKPFTSTYDCCVACLLDPTCGATSSSSDIGYCYLFNDGGNCTASREVGLYYTDASLLPNQGYIVSEGLCGMLDFGGVE